MVRKWTRRQLLGGAGAAGIALAGCAGTAPRPSPASRGHDGLQHFVSRPDLTPPVLRVSGAAPADDSRLTFLNAPWTGTGHGGSMIHDSRGELIWLGPNTPAEHRMDFAVQAYRGKPVLTWWEGLLVNGWGLGRGVIADSSYRTAHVIRAARGLQADLHELFLTPQGTALITAYRTSPADLSAVGGPASGGYVVSGVAQEIDIATGALVFEWDSRDHVPLTESHQAFAGGTRDNPYNYFHINSISVAPDGDLLISARNTWTIYKVARPSGRIAWRLGGKKSDFALGPGVRFHWQHHVRPHGPDVLTVFDNGAAPALERRSRGLILHLDTGARRVTLARELIHPGRRLLAGAMGSIQLLPGGRTMVGWGSRAYFSEFDSAGRLLADTGMGPSHPSYRALSYPWAGHPAEAPALAARPRPGGATVHASWNGATGVASWAVLAGPSVTSLAPVGSALRAGFETAIAVPSRGPYFAVEPRDAGGRPLARSAPARLSLS
ncbi:MAG TPA: arylsulfotransferase family protein [Streptosporangiaceae bacterium]|jgi:hypothetical protein